MTKTHIINIINIVIALLLGLWSYKEDINNELILLLPVFFAVMLMVLSQGVHYEQKDQSIISSILSIILTFVLLYLLYQFNEQKYTLIIMLLSNVIASYYLIAQAIKTIKIKTK